MNMNKHMHRILAGTLLAVLIGTTAPATLAADRGEARKVGPIERAVRFRNHVRHVAAELELTDAQKQDLRAIFGKEKEALLELRDDESMTRREKIAALREIRERVLDAIKGVLTVEQWEKWLALREDQRDTVRESVGN
jgi:Spy/CpxP family protein refolding chaperone